MDIEKLKQKILDLAIRGKLVPQNPNDETVQELIEKIRKEKELLISQGKIKRDKNESYIYKGSDNCYYRKIKDLIIPISTTSKEIKSKDVSNTGLYPVISQSKNYIDGYSNFDEKIIKTLPVILFGDHTKVVKFIDVPFIPGADGTKLFNSKCYSKYLYYLIMYASNKIENRGYGRHYALLKEFEVPYFEDINEQIYISIYLDYIFGKCYQVQEQKASIIKLIDRIKYKILDYYFGENSCYKSYFVNQNKECLKNFIPPNHIGDGDWVLSENMDTNGEYNLIQLKHIGNNTYLNKPYNKVNESFVIDNNCSKIFSGSLLINRLVSDRMNCCILPRTKHKYITSVDVCWISENEVIDNEYLMYLLSSPSFQLEVMNKCSGSTRKRISKKNLLNIKVFIHNYEYQILIKNKIKNLFDILDSINL